MRKVNDSTLREAQRLARAITRNSSHADDAAQDGLIKYMQADNATLATCVGWAWRDILRRESRHAAASVPYVDVASASEHPLELPAMSDTCRETANLLACGYSVADIAGERGVSRTAVYKTIENLRKILEQG